MKASDIIASIGVTILLIAFLFNMYKKISAQGRIYTGMNFLGAAICCFSSYLIAFYPFVVLEGVWGAFALYSFLNVPRGTSK
jgi:hypothetical protein